MHKEPSGLDDAVIPLADAFAPATREQWTALVEKTIKGAPLDSLNSRTAGGLALQPLYVAEDAANQAVAAPAREDGAWDVRALTWRSDPAQANAELLEALAGGATSALVAIGGDAVAVRSADDMARVLDGVVAEIAPVALDAGFLGPKASDWLNAVAKAAPAALLQFNMDPLAAFATSGASPGPIDSHIAAAATVGARLAPTYPKAGLFLASGRAVHEAGGSEADEIAFAAASGLAYAKALARAGMTVGEAFARISLGLAVDAEYFTGIAKLRAARLVWMRIAQACGAGPAPARIEARSSGRMLTRADAWTNMIRLTAAGFAAAVGGADAVVLGCFTDALGAPTAFARRQSRNTQLILQEEAYLGRVADPAAGTWYLERLTADLAAAAWAQFQAVEAAGGIAQALQKGLVAERAAAGRAALAERIASGELTVLGVTKFPNADDKPPETLPIPPRAAGLPDPRLPGPDSQCPPLAAVSLEDLAR
jgi:methylmalonyl-CoA mutase